MQRVYLDNNATTPVLPDVFEAMRPYLLEQYGNASSVHRFGQDARAAVERARDAVAALLHARPAEIVFTSGGTEGDNLALFGLVAAGDHVITSAIEHEAVLKSCERLEQLSCEITYLPVDARGLVTPEDLRRALRPNTRIVSIMMANNETGVVQPVQEIGRIIADANAAGGRKKIWFHTDAVQAAGKIEIDVAKIGCDLLTISGHKLHAPKGVGALYVRKGTLLQPQLYGGKHERSRRAGTENVPGVVALGKAAESASASLAAGKVAEIAALRERLEQTILREINATGVNGAAAPRTANTSNIYFDGIEGEALVIALDLKGLAVSSGAACSSGAVEPSHVLTAMGLSPDRARSSIRFSLGKQTTAADIDFALRVLPETVARLRELSPAYKPAVAR
jgi:cysteine desulfurase